MCIFAIIPHFPANGYPHSLSRPIPIENRENSREKRDKPQITGTKM